jgi:hypothetical protein
MGKQVLAQRACALQNGGGRGFSLTPSLIRAAFLKVHPPFGVGGGE